MANSHDIYTGDGVLTNFIYTFKILAASEISVELDGAVEAPANYTVNESLTRIEFSTPPAGGVHIKILRTSAIADGNKHVDFVAGSSPTESNFDTMYDHLLHLAQEAKDASSAKGPALGLDQVDDKWDGESKILKDLKDPLSDQEAATKLYADQLLQFGASGVPQVFAFTGDGTTLDFTLTGANAETNAGWIVALDGVLQAPSTGATVRDFKVESGKLTFEDGANPPPNGSLIIATNFGIAKNVLDGSVTVSAKAASDVPLTIKGVSGQTANLLELEDSSGTLQFKVSVNGTTAIQNGNLYVRRNVAQGIDNSANAHLNSGGVNDKPLVVRGFADQSANLQEWQNSDAKTLSLIKSSGRWRINNDITVFPHAADDASATVQINTKDSASEVLVLRAASNQSTNLQEWQNSSGVTLASINKSGSYGTTNGWVSAKKTRLGDTSQDMTNKTAYVEAQLSTDVPLTVQGDADQSANLQEWQDNTGSVVASVDNAGNIAKKLSHYAQTNRQLRYDMETAEQWYSLDEVGGELSGQGDQATDPGDDSFKVVLTPQSVNSKFLITWQINGSGHNLHIVTRVLRDSTGVEIGGNEAAVSGLWSTNNPYAMQSIHGRILDSPNTTSAVTYRIQVRSAVGDGSFSWNGEDAFDTSGIGLRGVSSIMVEEVF